MPKLHPWAPDLPTHPVYQQPWPIRRLSTSRAAVVYLTRPGRCSSVKRRRLTKLLLSNTPRFRQASTLAEIAPGAPDLPTHPVYQQPWPIRRLSTSRAAVVYLTRPGRCSSVKRRRLTKLLPAPLPASWVGTQISL
ncbi:MAG: hypothetical protein WD038_06445 [Balneolales bacterium]